MKMRLEWEPRDCWVGVYTRRYLSTRHIWICVLPMLPLHIIIRKPWQGVTG